MTVEELQSVIVYLQDKIEKLEEKKLCECDTNKESKPEYKATPKEVFVTNYNEDEECLTCSAQLFFLLHIYLTLVRYIKKSTKLLLYFRVVFGFWLEFL